jgi:hypothetical protein
MISPTVHRCPEGELCLDIAPLASKASHAMSRKGCTLIKCLVICGLVAWSISLMTIDGDAASRRVNQSRCASVSCLRQFTPGVDAANELRRYRRTQDAVSRLQNKIAQQQAERRQQLGKSQKRPSYLYAYSPRQISCRTGRQLVRGQGFYRVNALECQGRTFTYLARENGKLVRVTVDSRHGRIIGTRPF